VTVAYQHRFATVFFTPNAETLAMKKITRYINQLINTIIPNSPVQSRAAPHQVSLHHSSTSFSSPSFPTRPDFRSNGSLVNYARRCIGKKKTI
jgi:hypothetical protein